jgi:predicted  nucleic acid-binding Zn-ribbon protein
MKAYLLVLLLIGGATSDVISQDQKEIKGPENVFYSAEEIGTQGNWRKKKDWLKQAIDKNEGIQNIVADVQGSRGIFNEKSQKINEIIDSFYQKTGFERGEVTALFQEIEKNITEAKAKIKAQYADTYAIEESFKTYKTNLEQLKLDMQTVTDLDTSIRERLKQADTQINVVQSEADRAQELSKKIWDVIDDTKARNIFYDLYAIQEKLKGLKTYIKEDLVKDLDSVIATVQDQIKKVTESIDALEKQGITIINKTKKIETDSEKKVGDLEQEAQKPVQKKPVPTSSWWDSVKTFWHLFF